MRDLDYRLLKRGFERVFVMRNCGRERGGGGWMEDGGLFFTTSLFLLLSLYKTWFMLVLSYHVLGFLIGLFTRGDLKLILAIGKFVGVERWNFFLVLNLLSYWEFFFV